jgi:high-affinity iron transporter
VETVQGNFAALKADFQKAAEMLGEGTDSPMALFLYSLMIILREGIEAILIITAIIAYLVKTDNRDKLKVIYNGCIAALVLSVITALLVKWVFKISAASQEALEGSTMLLASLVLFSVSYWLISKAESQKWVSYIRDKVGDSLSSRSLKTLWFAAFLAVYREGAETVLFYQALASGASASGLTAVAGGFVAGSVLLVAIYLGMRYGALKLPIRPFFLCTGVLLYYMAFVFVGNGMMELIEAKMFQSTLVSWMPTIGFMGIYPYLQTLVPQLLIILAALAALVVMARQRAVPAARSAEG